MPEKEKPRNNIKMEPKQFENKSMIVLLYLIAGWCYANKALPRRIDIWVDDGKECKYQAVMNYCPHEPSKEDDEVINQECKIVPDYPIIDEHNVQDEQDPLTTCERNHKAYLDRVHEQNWAPDGRRFPR